MLQRTRQANNVDRVQPRPVAATVPRCQTAPARCPVHAGGSLRRSSCCECQQAWRVFAPVSDLVSATYPSPVLIMGQPAVTAAGEGARYEPSPENMQRAARVVSLHPRRPEQGRQPETYPPPAPGPKNPQRRRQDVTQYPQPGPGETLNRAPSTTA